MSLSQNPNHYSSCDFPSTGIQSVHVLALLSAILLLVIANSLLCCPLGPTSPAYSPTSPVSMVISFYHVYNFASAPSKFAHYCLLSNQKQAYSQLPVLIVFYVSKENDLTAFISPLQVLLVQRIAQRRQ